MAKRLCDPTSGKIGNQVYQNGRYGQVVRTRAIPVNPRSEQQMLARTALATAARGWDQMTEAERDAWNASAAAVRSKSRLGMSGTLTGLQLFVKINAALSELGTAQVTTPPALPAFTALPIDALSITNTAGTIAIRLHTAGSPPESTLLRVAKPQKAGVNRCPDVVTAGTLTSPVANYVAITNQYAAIYGTPAVGQKVFVKITQTQNGWEDLPLTFSAIVPASS